MFVILNCLGYVTYERYGLIQAITTLILSIFTGFGLCLTFSRINTQSTSKDLKQIISRRHMWFYIVYLFFIAYALLEYTVGFFTQITNVTTFLLFRDFLLVTGIPLAIIRISEPYVWVEFKRALCCRKSITDQFSEESLDTFIKSACKSEYATISLVGIL